MQPLQCIVKMNPVCFGATLIERQQKRYRERERKSPHLVMNSVLTQYQLTQLGYCVGVLCVCVCVREYSR